MLPDVCEGLGLLKGGTEKHQVHELKDGGRWQFRVLVVQVDSRKGGRQQATWYQSLTRLPVQEVGQNYQLKLTLVVRLEAGDSPAWNWAK